MSIFIDQIGRKISLEKKPERIISTVPSQTELLYDLGVNEEVKGITKFCVHPEEWFRTKPRIGGTKKIDFEKVHALKPDLIIGNKEENDQKQMEELMKHYPVWMSDIKNTDEALSMIESIGTIVDKKSSAEDLIKKIKTKLQSLNSSVQLHSEIRTAYFIWYDPLITVGRDTFIHDMLSKGAFSNIFGDQLRYPEVTKKKLTDDSPELILLSSEPFPFKEKHVEEFRQLCPEAKILLVDGEMFSWYGSRLITACDYIRNLVESIYIQS